MSIDPLIAAWASEFYKLQQHNGGQTLINICSIKGISGGFGGPGSVDIIKYLEIVEDMNKNNHLQKVYDLYSDFDLLKIFPKVAHLIIIEQKLKQCDNATAKQNVVNFCKANELYLDDPLIAKHSHAMPTASELFKILINAGVPQPKAQQMIDVYSQ